MSPTIRRFTEEDIAPALALSQAAGWNQLDVDWSRLIDYQNNGCFVAEIDGRLVGTVTTTSYGTRLAWIGMMLVDPHFRRLGIATALMNTSLEYLRAQRVTCIKLDATPDGQPVYAKLGFQVEWSYHRWQHELKTQGFAASHPIVSPLHWPLDLDFKAFGADRSDWLSRLAGNSLCVHHSDGFGMIRPGHRANYLGPVTALNAAAASQIIRELLSQISGNVFWDVPQTNRNAVELAANLGFARVRDLTRMWFGEPLSPELELQYAISDPGTG